MRQITVGRGRYRKISDIYPLPKSVRRVVILSGTYNEQLLLVNDCTFELEVGAVIDYNANNYSPTVTCGLQQVVNCTVVGGTIRRSGSMNSAGVVIIDNESSVGIESTIIAETKSYPMAIELRSGSLTFKGDVTSPATCIYTIGGNLTALGNFNSLNDYCVWISKSDSVADVKGSIFSKNWTALACYGGRVAFEGSAISEGLFGVEKGSGTATLRNSHIESRKDGGKEEGDAISNYGGEALVLDNCTLKCFNLSAYSIATQGTPKTVTLLSDCYANRPNDPDITLEGAGKLVVG